MSALHHRVELPSPQLSPGVELYAWAHQEPGERMTLHLCLRVWLRQKELLYEVVPEADPRHLEIARDPSGFLMQWAADSLRSLALSWERAAGRAP